MNDPIGDMLTRIRNGQMRGKSTVETPASKLRGWVLDVLSDEGYIRGYEAKDGKDGHPAFEISLKYYEGTAVIREVKRVSKGCDVGCKRTGGQCWRRSALHCILRSQWMSRIGKKPVELPSGVSASVSGQTIEVKGPKGTRTFTATDDVTLTVDGQSVAVEPRGKSKRARQQWGMSRTMVANLATGVSEGFKKELEISGVGYRAQMQGNTLKLSLGYSHDVNFEVPAGVTVTAAKPTD